MPDFPRGAQSQFSGLSRRSALKGIGGAALAAPLGLLSACGGSGSGAKSSSPSGAGPSSASGSGSSGGTISFGSNNSDAAGKQAFAALAKDATATTGVKIGVNTSDHDTFQSNISSYLQGTPDDLFTWFSGYRMQFFAAQGLVEPIDDVWDKIGPHFGEAAKTLSKGIDGHYYFVPFYNYPWVVFYNKSVFAKKGYTVPTKWADFIALAKQMKKDGIVPLAFGNKDLWPGVGTFDILNMRINGFDYHQSLMKHKTPWTDKGVTAVFDQWRELLPYYQEGSNGRTWQDAAKALEGKQAGMMFQGTAQVAANYSAADLPDLDFFVYPEINPTYAQDYMDAPTDGFMLAKKGKHTQAGKQVLEYLGTAAAEAKYLKTAHWEVGVATGGSQADYNAIQKKSVRAIEACKAVGQFMDGDTDPAMATAVEQLVQKFVADPSAANIASIQKSAENQAKTIFS
jgi:multiple sugar transport system substrate-binding protein